MEKDKKCFDSSFNNFGFLALTLLFFTFGGCAGRMVEKSPVLDKGQPSKKVTGEKEIAPSAEVASVVNQGSDGGAFKSSKPVKTASVTESNIKPEQAKPEQVTPEQPEPAKALEGSAVKSAEAVVVPVVSPVTAPEQKQITPPEKSVKPIVAVKTDKQAKGSAVIPKNVDKKRQVGDYKKKEIRVLEIPQTTLEGCIACGKSVKELRAMGLSEEEIKTAVREKLDRLNKISRERRKEYDKKREVDFSGIKDCIACGKSGKDLKAMGMTPEQIRAAYKEKYMKLKEQRERNLKSKKGQQLSEKIKEAYSRQKKNMAVQLKAEKQFVTLLEENLKNLREVASPPDASNFPPAPEGMVFVPAGKFLMGVEWGEDKSAMPARQVHVDSFFIDKNEVTVAAYKVFMKKRLRGRIPFYLRDKEMGGDDQPAFKVSWQDANDFCEGKEKRLPTEAEWEKAARGWDNRLFPWGNEMPEKSGKYKANYNPGRKFEDGFLYTAPVGSFSEWGSPYGVMDLAGNVWEWTADWYDGEYYKRGPNENPKGPLEGKERVIRGGGYNTPLKRLLLTTRLKERPNMRRGYLGFRCVRSVR